jgi:nitrite reductase/ring-hydroxylating ferredoxin subunit/uncharacterized membrane protein
MISCEPEKIFTSIPDFEKTSTDIARSIHNAVLQREEAREFADALHGTWLEHPLHPALTDFVVGAWVLGTIMDSISCLRPSRSTDKAADLLISIGNIAAVPTALSGMADFSTAPKSSIATAATHAIMNAGGLLLNLMSSSRRRSGRRNAGRCLSATASSLLLVSAWLGGKLVYDQKVGVNKIPEADSISDWKFAGGEYDLRESTPKRVEVDGAPVAICRCGTRINAIGAVCGHEGGPLEKGKVEGTHVTCPWHQSVYDLQDGHVVHGPSTYPEPVYETRVLDGNVEIRRSQALSNL